MARGKHAAALFEVIHNGRQTTKPILTTPSWWFKRKHQGTQISAIAAASRPAHAVVKTPFDHTIAEPHPAVDETERPPIRSEATPSHDDADANDPTMRAAGLVSPLLAQRVVQPPTESHAVCGVRAADAQTAPAPTHVIAADDSVDEPFVEDEIEAPARIVEPKHHLAIDKAHQLITLQLPYTWVIIGGFAVAVTIGMAFIIGRKMNGTPALAIASETTEQIRGKSAHPDVLNLPGLHMSGGKTSAKDSSLYREPEAAMSSRSTDSNTTAKKENELARRGGNSAAAPTTSPAIADASAAREVGLNYVVIQSYADQKSAEDARDALLKSGVVCTVEQGLRGMSPTRFCVVGTQGFARISSQDCLDYCGKLEELFKKLAVNKRSFRSFQPMAYKWDKTKAN